MLDEIFLRILDMTKTGSIVILAVLLARLLLKKAPKTFSYALWAVVLFRLLCPVSFEAQMSLLPKQTSVSQSYELAEEPISVVGAGIAAYQAVGDAFNGGLGIQHVPTTQRDPMGNVEYVTTDWWNVVLLSGQYLWLAGVAVMLLYSGISYGKLQKKLRVAVPLENGIFLADDIQSPFVVGFLRPRIYLPGGLEERERQYILLHERQHIKRFDPLIKILAYAALCLHWFNPLVWLAFVLACKDMEMSCDEAVLKKLGGEIRAEYAASLLALATGRRIIAGTPLAFGEGDPKERIKNLAKWKKPARWVIGIAAVGCIILGLCLVADPTSGGEALFPGEDLHGVGSLENHYLHPAESRLEEGTYIPVECMYINPLSSYYPYNISEDYQYTVTVDSFITEGILIENGINILSVDWRWQTLAEAEAALAFLKETPYYDQLVASDCLYQQLDATRCLLKDEDGLYLIQHTDQLWYIFMLKPVSEANAAPQPKKLTLADVLALSQKGEALVWEDLTGFENEDIGSGLYICQYRIDPAWYLQVSDGKQTGSPMRVELVSTLTGASVDIRTENVAAFIAARDANSLEVMTENAIPDGHDPNVPDGLIHVKSHIVLREENAISTPLWGKTERVTEKTLYLLVMHKSYNMSSGIPAEVGGSCSAAAVTFSVDAAGQYRLKEYWEPGDGEDYADAIRQRFPGDVAEIAMNPQPCEPQLSEACYRKACTDLVPTDSNKARIKELFWEISAYPAQYSMPGPYIEAHPEQWQELLFYREGTLLYCFAEFTPSGQKGLVEMLMALACEEILETMGEQDFPPVEGHGNGSQWFNHFKEYAQLLEMEKSREEIKRRHPGAWLYLQLYPQIIGCN